MKRSRVKVQWRSGLHLRPAARLVRLASKFRSEIRVRFGSRLADARSILSILLLSAGLGSSLDIEALGADEHDAIAAVEALFNEADHAEDASSAPPVGGVGDR